MTVKDTRRERERNAFLRQEKLRRTINQISKKLPGGRVINSELFYIKSGGIIAIMGIVTSNTLTIEAIQQMEFIEYCMGLEIEFKFEGVIDKFNQHVFSGHTYV